MSLLAPGRNIVLIGLMGAGKSTVGRLLAERLGRPFVDTDEVVEREAGMPVREIFATEGERGFRAREAAAVRAVAALRGQVVAVGGGAVLDHANVTQLRMSGDLVWLDAPAEVLAGRLVAEEAVARPLLDGGGDAAERLAELQARRRAAYERAAALRVDTEGRSPEEVAEAVLEQARRRPGLLSEDEVTA